jgi:hypothetical protein
VALSAKEGSSTKELCVCKIPFHSVAAALYSVVGDFEALVDGKEGTFEVWFGTQHLK